MPADYSEFFTAFADLVGTSDEQDIYTDAPFMVADADAWIDLFGETGIDFDDSDATIEAFETFLLAFYPQTGMSGEDWFYARQEFYDMYGIDDSNIDWEAWREAIGY